MVAQKVLRQWRSAHVSRAFAAWRVCQWTWHAREQKRRWHHDNHGVAGSAAPAPAPVHVPASAFA